jgi:hypothetical protein
MLSYVQDLIERNLTNQFVLRENFGNIVIKER